MINMIGGWFNPAPQLGQQPASSGLSDTIIMVALGALALVGANACDRDAPGLAVLLRCVPVGLTLVWLFKRCCPAGSYGQGYVPYNPQPAPIIIQQPAPQPWWQGNWFGRNLWPAPVHRQQPQFVPQQVPVYVPPQPQPQLQPHLGGFPAVMRAPAQQTGFPPVQQVPVYVPPQPHPQSQTNYSHVQPVPVQKSGFPAVQRAPAQQTGFPQVHKAPAQQTGFPQVQRVSAQPLGQTMHQAPVSRHQPTPSFNPQSGPQGGNPGNGRQMFPAALTR